MTSFWELLGAGAALSWLALSLLGRVARSPSWSEPESQHGRLLSALLLSATLFAVPALGACLPHPVITQAPVQIALRILASASAHTSRGGPPLISGITVSPFALLGVVWAAAAAWATARALVLGWQLRQLVARAQPAPARLEARYRKLARALSVPAATLLVSDEAAAPFAVGPRAPVIVLPALLLGALSDAQQELVLRHELWHVRRGDLGTSLLINACSVLFAGHPAARSLVQEIHLAREAAVDAQVARSDPHAYAMLLVEVASLARSGKKLAHVSMDDTALTRRIAMLTNRSSNQPKLGRRAVVAVAVAAATLGLAVPDVLADPPNIIVGSDNAPPPFPAHDDDIDACFADARKADPKLTVDTMMRLEGNRDGKVLSASAPTPNSPTFQQCIEAKALGWTLPLPPDGAKRPPADAKLMIVFPIRRP